MARSRDFNTHIRDLLRASNINPVSSAGQQWMSLAERLDTLTADVATVKAGTDTKVSGGGSGDFNVVGTSSSMRVSAPIRAIGNQRALFTQAPGKSPTMAILQAGSEQIAGVDDPDCGYPLEIGSAAEGEAIQPSMAVHVRYENGGHSLYLATATDETKFCNGVVVRGTGKPGQFMWRGGGTTYPFILFTGSGSSRLRLSVTPGFLTDDPAEDPMTKAFDQEVGQLLGFLQPLLIRGDSQSSIGRAWFQYSPPANT